MAGYLLDTNHLGAALTIGSGILRRFDQARRSGIRLGTCVPVLCELEAGIQQTRDLDRRRRVLKLLFRYFRIWPIDPPLAEAYGAIFIDLVRRGRSLSHVDIVLAALARQMDLTLLTTDRDFEALPDVKAENWLT